MIHRILETLGLTISDLNNQVVFEQTQIRRAAVFCSILAFFNALYILLFFDHIIYAGFSFCVFVSYMLIIYLYPRVSGNFMALYISFVSLAWVNSGLILFGHFFSASAASAATYFISYVLLRHKKPLRNAVLMLNIALYVGCTSFLYFKEPIVPIDNPIDQIFIYLGALAWIIAVAKIYENEKSNLLTSMSIQNDQLNSTKEELERFTYIASHDLKSPLRTVISFLGILEKDLRDLDKPELLDTLNFAQTGAKQMSSLVNDILEWSVVNSNVSDQERKFIDLKVAVTAALNNIDQEIKAKGARVIVSDLFMYPCNKSEFTAIFQNIIHNGIKYNASDAPRINVWVEKNKGILSIKIKDNGIGIDEQYKDQVFEYFKRLHTSAEYEGTGLGLGLCKKIVEKYDGRIRVESNKPDQGSTFIIELPLGSAYNLPLIKNEKYQPA